MKRKIIRAGIETFGYNESLPRMADMLIVAGHGTDEVVGELFPEAYEKGNPAGYFQEEKAWVESIEHAIVGIDGVKLRDGF